MNRSQDTVIDEDEETCPLCIEEFDLSDKNFRPCPCGYQICQFCFNSLKNTYEKSTCPNCRRPYDEKTIQYKIPTAEEFKLDQMNKNKKAAAKRKETEKREVENSSRRNLAGVRVKQQNLVYVIGLIPQIKDEQALLQTLRGPEYFGQYGEIEKIVVSKAKPGAANQGIGVYVTYARKEDAALCINTVDGSLNGDRVLRAQYGTTKYCSAFLRGETCTNKNCSFLHETGEDGQHSSLQNEPHGARLSNKPTAASQSSQTSAPARPLSAAQNHATTNPMARQGSKEEHGSRKNSHDGSALPSTAHWATANASVARTRRASQANSRATPSPQMAQASLVTSKTSEPKGKEPASQPSSASATASSSAAASTAPKKTTSEPAQSSSSKLPSTPADYAQQQFDAVVARILPNAGFVYDDSFQPPEFRELVRSMPSFIDPYGGLKRLAMREREEKRRAQLEAETKAKLEAQATSAAEETLDEDSMNAGSLALGGEPEDDPRSSSARGAIGRPSQSIADQLLAMNLNSRNLTAQQRQQLAFLNLDNVQQAPGLGQPSGQNTAFEMSDFDRRGPQYSQAQYDQISSHQRHGSRYFNTDSKSTSANRFQGQQQTFYSSGVQGPPPGLPTAGTPPVSGGGMFAHGQNFTNPGFGTSKDANTEVYARNRSGTNQGPEVSKRGGVEHLADPSIVTARVHQGNTAGQGLFGGNQVDDKNFPPLPLRSSSRTPPLHSRVSSFHSLHSSGIRSTTPRIPPGFELTHAHPLPPSRQATPAHANQIGARATPSGSVTVTPAIPLVPLGPRTSTPKPKAPETPKEGDEEHSLAVRKHRNGVNEISFGSPQLRTSCVKTETENKKSETSEVESEKEKKDEAPAPVKTADLKGKQKAADPKFEKIELPPTSTITSKAPLLPAVPDKPATPVLDSGSVGTPGALSSRPATPASVTTPSETPKVSTARPRTLRLTTGTTTKPAEPTPASAAPEKTIAAFPPLSAAKKGSRRPSLSSAQHSRPSTPAVSERQHSHDASRASSPPHSIVGSAPERVKSKSQQKKDRKEKAKKSTETGETSVNIPTPPIVEEVAPVIARQKKQKKRVESSTAANMDDSTKTREKSEQAGTAAGKPEVAAAAGAASTDNGSKNEHWEKDKKDSAAPEKTGRSVATPPPSTPKEEPASKAEDTTKTPYTLRDLYNEADKLGKNTDAPGVVQKLLQEHVSSMPKIISSMIQSGDLSKDHPWLNPQSFNSAAYKLPPDSRRGQDYLDGNGYAPNDAFGYIYLPLKEKQALKDGHAVSVADAGDRKDDLLRRCLVTPNGWVLRHLTADESEKVLELEERRQMYVEEFGEVGTMDGLGVLEADDYTNLGGGMEKLSRHGERHGVIWVVGDGEQVGEEDEFDTLDDEDEDDEVGEVGISDEEEPIMDDETGLNEADDAALDGHQGVNMPGAWQSSSSATNLAHGKQQSGGRASKSKLPALPAKGPQSLPHRHSNASSSQNVNNVNLRALDSESLQKRVAEKQKELEQSRKEMEKIEKLWNKKSKDIARWREGLAAKG
ncbi:transcriptional repressor general negative regulator of transcription subunit 4 [Exophiala dermatitidis]|uniref:Transcriptional repressor general negative regulator of transcription subunit 4 n=1 Tax=Exophiala dermatitidis TaxID=5970 RepID=A0AAN6IRA8_EXODE|nr:transcriptional repressor general negative regulator of transcription subunit 4 [Exophiala dermatitidis]KAJ4509475.1 transcriptional repressor general negative regulator of transcription subunit 4 [Exophiala dermatitidis]KAJ4576222.1 transcriptional repressor general negative regulator of transcription subunit 4 [Exophiala dermatitidis]KAJ4593424.1 transcriptional repressor general negative regulator of transcription subunit 4 [Exophiala dermatitidis]KAJ4600956.1 transcriptional repressor ge